MAGELAALSVVAAQAHTRGTCYLSHNRLAAMAGMSAATARNASCPPVSSPGRANSDLTICNHRRRTVSASLITGTGHNY